MTPSMFVGDAYYSTVIPKFKHQQRPIGVRCVGDTHNRTMLPIFKHQQRPGKNQTNNGRKISNWVVGFPI
jgi:hypothetical protein